MGIILTGRTVLRPLYRRIADLDNAAIFSATTLLVVLGTSMVTQFAGLSLALGAFLVRPLPASRGRAGHLCRCLRTHFSFSSSGTTSGALCRPVCCWRRPSL